MKTSHFALAIAWGFTLTAAHAAEVDRSARLLRVQKVMQGEELKFESSLAKNPDASTRDLPNAALLILRAHGPAVKAEAMLERVFAGQNMDESSADYGDVPWKLKDASVKDANAIEFTMQPMGAILANYADQFPTSFRKEMDLHLRAALVAEAHHSIKVSYTNIYLMNTVNTMLLAEHLGDEASITRARSQWKQWTDYTRDHGIHEFNSPTYYATDLADLTYGHLYIHDPAMHAGIVAAEDLLWLDIASMYLPVSQHLAGAHSRDYQFLTGRGSLEMNLYMEGWGEPQDETFTDPFLEKVAVLENERPGAYHPSQKLLALAHTAERTVEQRFDENDVQSRYTYLTQHFAISTAEGSYSPQDKMFAVDLVADKPLVSITVMPDASGSPYGVQKVRDKSGHNKPAHLPPNLSSVQSKGTALLVFDLDPSSAAHKDAYSTNLILPAHPDELQLDGRVVRPSSSLKETATPDSVVALRAASACFAARVLDVEPLDGKSAAITLRADSEGWENGAIRLEIEHAASVSATSQQHLHVTMLATVQDCGTAGLSGLAERMKAAKASIHREDTSFAVGVKAGDMHLDLEEDLQKRLPSSQKINGADTHHPVFNVNGQAMPVLP